MYRLLGKEIVSIISKRDARVYVRVYLAIPTSF